MGDRLVWTPDSRFLKSVYEIDWLRAGAFLRSGSYELRWLIGTGALVVGQIALLVHAFWSGQSAKFLINQLVGLTVLLYLAVGHAKRYADSRLPSEATTRERTFRVRFVSWVLYEPAPWLWWFGALLIVVFSLQCLADINSTDMFPPSARALGFSKPYTFQGEWWRMFTGPLLHHHGPHLVGNLVGWFVLCRFVEPLAARHTVPTIAFGGVLGASIFSLFILPRTVSVGFSGALSGLTAFLLLLMLRRRKVLPPQLLVAFTMCALTGAASDWTNSATTDYAGHAGGFAAGLALGFLLIDSNRQEIPIRPRPWATRLGQLCGALLIADALFVVGKLVTIIHWGQLI